MKCRIKKYYLKVGSKKSNGHREKRQTSKKFAYANFLLLLRFNPLEKGGNRAGKWMHSTIQRTHHMWQDVIDVSHDIKRVLHWIEKSLQDVIKALHNIIKTPQHFKRLMQRAIKTKQKAMKTLQNGISILQYVVDARQNINQVSQNAIKV